MERVVDRIRKATMKSQEQLGSNVKAKILNIYEEYGGLPTRIQKDLSFNEYMDLYLEQLNMTDMEKRKYLELA